MLTTNDADSRADDRAARRLQAWAATRPDAARLACYAALAVRVDSALLRRLRLQLLPRAEPGIEADVWLAGLHASQGHDGFVFDARVQQVLRAQLAVPVPPGQPWPLLQAWAITQEMHADWPEALRTEEALCLHALQGAADSAAQIHALLAPALKAMASGGAARALEVARWAQRAMPGLPAAARQHPSALALWLGALLRLGLPAAAMPDTGTAGLPDALRWLLPPEQLATHQRIALTPLDATLRLQPLADLAPDAAQQIRLPRTRPLLLALQAHGPAGPTGPALTVALDDGAAALHLPLPADWQALDLHSLSGARWRLQREAGKVAPNDPPLAWQRTRVLVLNSNQSGQASQPSGVGSFVSTSEVLTVVDVLPPGLVQALRAGEPAEPRPALQLQAWDADGKPQRLQARLVALDLRSPLALLALQRPFDSALVAGHETTPVASGLDAWTVPALHADGAHWPGRVQQVQAIFEPPAGRRPTDALARHFSLHMPQTLRDLTGIAGAPVFVDHRLVGIADLASADTGNRADSLLWVLPVPAITRFLAWARRSERDAPQVLLHHAVRGADGKGAELDVIAVQRIAAAAQRAKLRLHHAQDSPDDPSFAPDLAAAVRLVTPFTRDRGSDSAGLRLLALAARRWAQPTFSVLQLSVQKQPLVERQPPPLAGLPLQDIDDIGAEALAQQLLDLAEHVDRPTLAPGPLQQTTQQWLEQQLTTLARPFQPTGRSLIPVLNALRTQDLPTVADLVVGRWNSSSRLDAVPLVELLAQLALPLPDNGLLDQLAAAGPGALALNAMPVQLARMLITRAHAGHAAPPCVAVRDQAWAGETSAAGLQAAVATALAQGLACSEGDANILLQRLTLAPWVLITTRPMPARSTVQALRARLPGARLLLLAGAQTDLPEATRALGVINLPNLPEGADMSWLAGFKRLMEWASPRQHSSRSPRRRLQK